MTTKNRILLVDDEPLFRDVLAAVFTGEFEVSQAENGKAAVSFLEKNQVDLVVSDIRMPGMNGVELLTWIKARSPKLPVVLITGFSELLETKTAFDYGASGFLQKPFAGAEALRLIKTLLEGKGKVQIVEEEDDEEKYGAISIEDFVAGDKIPYGIYLKLSDGRFVKISHHGEEITFDRIETYRKKKIHHMYLSSEDYAKYITMGLRLPNAGTHTGPIPSVNTVNSFLQNTNERLKQMVCPGTDAALFEDAKDFLMSAFLAIRKNSDQMNLLLSLQERADELYGHSLGVALYSFMIAKKMGWVPTQTGYKIILAGLFHDIGLLEAEPKSFLSNASNLLMSNPEVLHQTVNLGSKNLGKMKTVPPEVALAVLQHHELTEGSPIDPEAPNLMKILTVANHFSKSVIPWSGSKEKMSCKEAAKQLSSLHHKFAPDVMSGLIEMVK